MTVPGCRRAERIQRCCPIAGRNHNTRSGMVPRLPFPTLAGSILLMRRIRCDQKQPHFSNEEPCFPQIFHICGLSSATAILLLTRITSLSVTAQPWISIPPELTTSPLRCLRVAFSVSCRLLRVAQRPTAIFFFWVILRCFSSRARPVPCRIVQCLVTCVLVFMYLRTLVSCGFCCLIWDQIKSDWCWGNKWTGVFNNLWYAVTLNKNMETRCEYCFIISVLMSFDNEDCW